MFRYILTQLLLLCGIIAVAQPDIDEATSAERILLLGDSYVLVSNYTKARELYVDALKSADGIDEKWKAIDKIVDVNVLTNSNQESIDMLNDFMADDIARRDSTIMMNANNKLGYVYFNLQDYVRSIKSYYKGRTYMNGSADRNGKAQLLCNIAQTLIVAGDVREAEQQLNAAIDICPDPSKKIMANIYGLYAKVYEQYGNFSNAYTYLNKQLIVQTDLWKNERSELVGTKYPWSYYQKVEQNVNNEKRIKELEKYIEDRTDEYDNMSLISYVAIIFSILVLVSGTIFSIIGYRYRKIFLKQNKIYEERQRLFPLISRDFVAPFNSLIGYAESQLQYAKTKDDKDIKDYSRNIYEVSQSMRQMANSILVWSQNDILSKSSKKCIHVSDYVEKVVDVYKLIAEEKNIHIDVVVDGNATILADPTHFDIIIRNLIGNSLKFTLSGGNMRISVVQNSGKTSVVVDDTGIGIPAEQCERINNHEYYSHSKIGLMEERGIGLGLMICIDLAVADGALFGVDSVEGKGTTVTIVYDSK